ncbi:MAG: CvpA family protein [Pirellulales bacterium]|jgi:hypothetical protein
MTLVFSLLLLVIMVAVFASLMGEGLWSNAITFFNVTTAALLATNFWEPVASWLESMMPSWTYFWDFIALWGLFFVSLTVLRVATDFTSRVRVKFIKQVEQYGGYFFAVWVGWVMICFTTMTLSTAPLARNFLDGGFQPQQSMFLGIAAPDRLWLSFVQRMSMGPLSRLATPEERAQEKYVFDPQGEFLMKYDARRAKLESLPAFRVNKQQ